MFDKVNCWRIVTDHFGTFTHEGSGRPRPLDYLVFLGMPAVVTFFVCRHNDRLSDGMIGLLATVVSVVAGLLFNLLVLMYGLIQDVKPLPNDAHRLPLRFLGQIYKNISFSVLLCVATVVCLVTGYLHDPLVARIAMGAVTFFCSFFILTLLMVLKRIHVLLGHQYSEEAKAGAPSQGAT